MRWGVHKIDFKSIGMTIIIYGNVFVHFGSEKRTNNRSKIGHEFGKL